jgi:hypothetical protein
MKTGLTIVQMASELERRANAKRDFIADTRTLVATSDGGMQIQFPDNGAVLAAAVAQTITRSVDLGTNNTFRRQAHSHYKVPHDYAERIRTAHPQLYANTLNTFFQKEPTRQMIRTLDGNARAFLSDRYRPLDDFDLAQAVLPEIFKHQEMRVESSQFTEDRFYLKTVFPRIQADVKVGDPVQIGLVVSNSEVGAGSLQVMPLVYRLVCKNGLISDSYGQKRYHVGKRASGEESAYELYSEGTRQLDDAAFFSKVRDTVRGVLTQTVLDALVLKMRQATEQVIQGTQIQNVVEVTAKRFGYGENTSGGILRHLIEGGDLSRYGLMNAITRQSQDEENYETATRLELDGAKIIELPQADWKQIADAALAKAA